MLLRIITGLWLLLFGLSPSAQVALPGSARTAPPAGPFVDNHAVLAELARQSQLRVVHRVETRSMRAPQARIDPTGVMSVPLDGALTGLPLLNSFQLRFTNGDHHVRSIGVWPEGGSARFVFSDENGDDPYLGNAAWLDLRLSADMLAAAFPIREATGRLVNGVASFILVYPEAPDAGRGLSRKGIAERPTTWEPALVGFQIERRSGPYDVRTLRVRLDGTLRRGDVNLSADRGGDGTFRVSYVWLPSMLLTDASAGMLSGSGPSARATRARTLASVRRRTVLQGFEFRFDDRPHFLKNVGANLPAAAEEGTFDLIAWQDANRDDPIRWSVWTLQINHNFMAVGRP